MSFIGGGLNFLSENLCWKDRKLNFCLIRSLKFGQFEVELEDWGSDCDSDCVFSLLNWALFKFVK